MKKSISIILLGIYMLSTAPFNEVLKVHVLVEHYFEHKALDSSITFAEFFDIHYGEDVQKDADYERDMQLPFKTIGAESGAFALFHPSLPILKAFEVSPTIFTLTPLDYSFTYNSHLLSSIWQPPRA